MKRVILVALFPILASTLPSTTTAQPLNSVGRGECSTANGILRTKDAYATFGDSAMRDYEFSFRARAPKDQPQVQIWAGFHARDREDFYSFGFRGGEQNSLYLARRGEMGRDEFLALRPLGFHPVAGAWYAFRIATTGDRIRVWLGDEKIPLIDITYKNSRLLPSGHVILGGGWLTAE
ncbi:MAG: glycoside hydrolase family 2, partial [Bacteroidetes bacterium]|nr:glycoside hydrolase family 2 [Bacteroidota bacterium]